MGNAQGHHGDHHRKPSGYHGGTEGLTFGDRIPGRETSPFDPVRIEFFLDLKNLFFSHNILKSTFKISRLF